MAGFKKIVSLSVSLVFHLVAAGIIYIFWKPVAMWYWNYRPVLGVDFYNLTTFVAFLSKNFALQFNGWKYIWWGGVPLSLDYPILHAYLILPLLRFFSLPQAVQFYVLASVFIFLYFSYLTFAEIGKDRVLAVILTLLTAYSLGLYGSLVWGGSLSHFATQMFLPVSVYFLFKFFHSANKRWLFLSSLTQGISYLGHPQAAFSYIVPITFLLLLTYPMAAEKFISLTRVKRVVLYFVIALLCGYNQMGIYTGRNPRAVATALPSYVIEILSNLLGLKNAPSLTLGGGQKETGPQLEGNTKTDIAMFDEKQLNRIFSDTQPTVFIFMGLGVALSGVTLLLRKHKRDSLKVLVHVLPVGWVVAYAFLASRGINIYHGGWYRIFWAFPFAAGIFISFTWGDFWAALAERIKVLKQTFLGQAITIVASSVIALGICFWGLKQYPWQSMFTAIEKPLYRQNSSAFPDSLNVYIDKREFTALKERLVPGWLNPNDMQYRLYEADQRVSVWWNALFDMPQFKGYIDVTPADAAGNYYWTSIALTQGSGIDHLVKTWKVPEAMAYNNALFLIDWFSLKYMEAEHEKSDSYNPLTTYLARSDIFAHREKISVPGWAQFYQIPDGEKIKWHPKEEVYLTYYEVKDEFVSPIMHSTDAPVLGVVGTRDNFFTILRVLAALNLNSRNVIPVNLGKFIDDIPLSSLKDMDAVILYGYDYRNHQTVWKKLDQYVRDGGKVFVETGSEVKQTDSVNLPASFPRELPEIFPLVATRKSEMGSEWNLEVGNEFTELIDVTGFSPPVLDGKPWVLSLPETNDTRTGTEVILSNQGKPVVATWKVGKGEVIWSGMNLPYHITIHKNMVEAQFFMNLIKRFTDLDKVSYAKVEAKRLDANRVRIKGKDAKGVLLREHAYATWTAELTSTAINKKLRVYHAGPMFSGFIYVRLPKEAQDSFAVTFSYQGEFWTAIWQIVSLLTVLTVIDYILGGLVIVPLLRKFIRPFRQKMGKVWEKDDDY